MELSIITFGEKAEAILGNHPFKEKDANKEDFFFLIVTDDVALYQDAINGILANKDICERGMFLVVDLNAASDYAQFKSAWTRYNKVEDVQTVKNLVTLIQHHIIQPSMISFDTYDLYSMCSMGEYLGSIYVERGIEGLDEVNAPTNAKALAVGVCFMDLPSVAMEQMDKLNEFFQKLEVSKELRWSVASAPKDEVVMVYSYNK